MRKKIYKMVHVYEGNTFSVAYKYFMIAIIAVSLIPLTTKEKPSFLGITEGFCLLFFVIDYLYY